MVRSMVVLSAFAATALAQSSTYSYTFPQGFNLGLVDSSTKSSWCEGQRNTCPQICGGAASQNTCIDATLQFNCVCVDGSQPNVTAYQTTIPFYVCNAYIGQCLANNAGQLDAQEACKEVQCGNKNATDSSSSSSSSSSSTTAASSSASSESTGTASSTMIAAVSATDASMTASSSAAATTTHNAAPIVGLEGYSTGIMAGAMFLAARLFL
ncbi:hypothetical protein POX_c04325 [Penicillium oxalicum]|uniref:DUF7707 domain-containing protein n=1 Tax=Penicillium oxalicum (strain 114-2 / CGMCC 5302) TaxID=933388 RepID=S7Z604_PENO1|nr:hypothetical protein POX_c04325 [Penicillium oxalicum]EPS25950.1 hypothetical protein PDE_00886 [Penicillium oxalicum 114-2]KAI2791464.1 hypothetical protein POX_c04325 [Penicillium oxalicum]